MREPAMKKSAARQGWLYVGAGAASVFAILFCLVALKFFTEDRLAPKDFGLGGVLSRPKLDLLLIGSSHTRKSYDMRQLEKMTGVTSSFQIGYNGTDLTTISQMLDYLVSKPDHCPRYLVVEAYSALLARKPDMEDPRYYSDAPPALKRSIIRSYLAGRGGYRSALLDVFDLVVNRGNDEIITYPFYSLIVKKSTYKGGRTDFYFPGLSPEEFRRLRADPAGNAPNPAQLAALYHILDLTKNHGIPVIFIDTPLPQPVSSEADIQSLKKYFGEILGARHIPYIDGDRGFPVGDPALFSDSNHLSSQGRKVFTSAISVQLKSWMASNPGAMR